MNFSGAVLREVGKPLEIEALSLKDLLDQDVVVRVKASSLCHTDLVLPFLLFLVTKQQEWLNGLGKALVALRKGIMLFSLGILIVAVVISVNESSELFAVNTALTQLSHLTLMVFQGFFLMKIPFIN